MVLRNTRQRTSTVRFYAALLAAATTLAGCRSTNSQQHAVPTAPKATQDAPWVGANADEDRGETDEDRRGKPALGPLGPSSTLDDYRLYAALNNPGLRALYHEWRAARELGTQATAPPEPRFRYTEFLEEVETRVGPQERKYALTLFIPWLEKLSLRSAIADEGARAAWQRLQAEHLSIDTELTTAYAEYYYLGRSLAITREDLELLRSLESVARQEIAAGDENYADVIQLQIGISRLEDRLASLTDMRKPHVARLNAILNRPRNTEVPWPQELPRRSGSSESFDERAEGDLLRRLEEQNPQLVALEREVDRAALGKKLAFRSYYPDFSFGFEAVDTGPALAPNTRGSGDDAWALMFGVELPLWYWKYRAQEREADARWRASMDRLADRKNRLAASLELALHKRRDAEREISLYQSTLTPQAREWVRTAEAALGVGSKDFDDVIAAHRALLEFQLLAERAQVARLKARAEIDGLLGRFVVHRNGKEAER